MGAPDERFYTGWLAALKTLDFDALSRNAQVGYLFIKKKCEVRLARAGFKQGTAPRKNHYSGITGPARGRGEPRGGLLGGARDAHSNACRTPIIRVADLGGRSVQRVRACRDPHDNKVLEAAVNGRADVLVTGDKDLLELLPFRGIAVVGPAD